MPAVPRSQSTEVPGPFDASPDALPEYGTKTYWDDEYAKTLADEPYYDWFFEFDAIAPILEAILGKDRSRSILHLGSGNSTFPDDLWELGYKNQLATDISEVCVQSMQRQAEASSRGLPPHLHVCADARAMPEVADETFDVVFEKGTLDALFCDEGDHAWNILTYLREVRRVLTADRGIFVLVSMYAPRIVDLYLKLPCFAWDCRYVQLADKAETGKADEAVGARRLPTNFRYVYILSAAAPTVERGIEAHWDRIAAEISKQPDEDPKRTLTAGLDGGRLRGEDQAPPFGGLMPESFAVMWL